MLRYIKIKNINSIGECEIDFSKDKYKYLEDNVVDNLVNPLALYGHNGSGKTSLIRSISYLISLLVDSVDNLKPFIVNQFLVNKYNSEKKEDYLTGSIELHFDTNKTCYEYFISISIKNKIVREYLKCGDFVFDRGEDEENYLGKKEKIKEFRSLLIPSLRYLASEKVNDNKIQNAFKFITSFVVLDLPFQNAGPFVVSRFFQNIKKADLIVAKSNEVKEILKGYKEFPVYDAIKIENSSSTLPSEYYIKFDNVEGYIPFGMMSSGMLNQSSLLSILVSLPNESVLFIDEVEQALHPSSVMAFINVVKQKRIQLVFSSHNTFILQRLRPDQIYFSTWKNGFSTFKRLSKIYPNIREINNIEKMYLSSVFDEVINE